MTRWRVGDRVTAPFVCGCGRCPTCLAGHQQVCANQTQPGFTHWGSFAQFVAVEHADVNLVRLPDGVDDRARASGCRFATAYRAVVSQGRVAAGEWVAVHGCGGVGLSAVMIAAASGARVVAVDMTEPALALARDSVPRPADVAGRPPAEDAAAIATSPAAARTSRSTRSARRSPRGGHPEPAPPGAACAGRSAARRPARPLPMDRVIGSELELLGSHGMAAHAYPEMLALITGGGLTRPGWSPGDHPRRGPGRTVHHGQGNGGRDPPDRARAHRATRPAITFACRAQTQHLHSKLGSDIVQQSRR